MKPICSVLRMSWAVVLLGMLLAASAQAFPIAGKPIRIVVPFPPGGQADTYARMIGQRMGESLGVPVVVETKPGASTAIGALDVQRSEPDGHTLLFTNPLTYAQSPHLRSKLTYDPKGYTAVFNFVYAANVLVAHPSVPVNSMAELIAYAKANPNKLNYASISIGSSSHLLMERLQMEAGIVMNHVPYKGSSDAENGLLGGQVELLFAGLGTATPLIGAKRVKPLGIAARARSAALPDVPTIAETGIKGMELEGFIAFFGPPQMPDAVTNRLNAELQKVLDAPEMREFIVRGGNVPAGGSAESFRQMLVAQTDAWGQVVQRIGLKLD